MESGFGSADEESEAESRKDGIFTDKKENPKVKAGLPLPVAQDGLGSNFAPHLAVTVGLLKAKRLKYSTPFCASKLDHKSRDAIFVGLETKELWTGNPFRDE